MSEKNIGGDGTSIMGNAAGSPGGVSVGSADKVSESDMFEPLLRWGGMLE